VPAGRSLPDFPWDRLAPASARARAHPGGIVDLSVGTPVDPTPTVAREALTAAGDAPGYPFTAGTPALREAMTRWAVRRLGAPSDVGVLPTIGSKELVGLLPSLLGLGAGDTVVHPVLAYPTYEVGALLAGAVPLASDEPSAAAGARLVWLNSPANPTGQVLTAARLRERVDAARAAGAIVVSDECYLDFGWDAEPVSVLSPQVSDGRLDGLLAVHSLSKRSNLAGYRAGLVLGDPELVARLLEIRKHAGMIVPTPVQAAMVACLDDEDHVVAQRARYAARRAVLRTTLEGAGFRVEHSEAGLYLWGTRDEPCWATVDALAGVGILVAPGDFYGPAGGRNVRVALTATDERVGQVAERLASLAA
jgi:succinyldiaminopimelate transaminase